MSNPTARSRPEPGTVTVKILKVKVCVSCGYLIDESGLCSYDCPEDADDRKKVIVATYERTDKFLGDDL